MEGGSFKASRASVREQLVGAKEVAEIIGVSRGTLTAYLSRKQMVEPLIELACGPIWLRMDIERWNAKRPGFRCNGEHEWGEWQHELRAGAHVKVRYCQLCSSFEVVPDKKKVAASAA